MRSRLKKVLVTLLTGLLIAVVTPGHSLFSRPVTVPQHFRAEFLPEGVLVPGVPFHIRIRLTAVTGFCKPFTVSYDKMGTLELLEAPVTQHAVDSGQSFETTVLVKCKANDTSTIRVRFSCVGKGSGDQTRAWLVSDDSSVVVLQKYPSRKPAVKPDPKAIQKERFRKDAEADSARYRRIDDIKHAVPQITAPATSGHLKMVPPPPSLDDLVPAAPLPGVAIISRTDFQVKQLEAKPADNLELYWVEGAHYLRQAGDTLFQRFLFSERDFAATDRWRRTLIGLPEDFRNTHLLG